MMHVYGQITGTLSAGATLSGSLATGVTVSGSLTVPEIVMPPSYTGAYTVTPSAETQLLHTSDFYMQHDIEIEPIPENYGLITWDGHTITVS